MRAVATALPTCSGFAGICLPSFLLMVLNTYEAKIISREQHRFQPLQLLLKSHLLTRFVPQEDFLPGIK